MSCKNKADELQSTKVIYGHTYNRNLETVIEFNKSHVSFRYLEEIISFKCQAIPLVSREILTKLIYCG